MHSLITDNLVRIQLLCEEYGVERLEVFGSITTAAFDPARSDVDFLVTYPEGYDFGPWLGRYFALRERLAELLGREVDLVRSSALQRERFRRLADQTRQVVYVAPKVAALA
jgi:predicted nucleotidyltransferase